MNIGRRAASRLPLRGLRAPALSPSAFTLVELLLVLVIVGLIAAAAWPSVLRMQADHDLSAAAEQVRQQLGNARTWAIHAGTTYQFRFEPKGQRYCVVPFEPGPIASGTSNATAASAIVHRFSGAVSKRISFLSRDASGLPSTQKVPVAAFQGLPNAGELSSVGWSGPVIFTPDGSAMDALVTVTDQRGQRIEITIRGLTGAAAVGLMQRGAAP